jgi:hypothetical protein
MYRMDGLNSSFLDRYWYWYLPAAGRFLLIKQYFYEYCTSAVTGTGIYWPAYACGKQLTFC